MKKQNDRQQGQSRWRGYFISLATLFTREYPQGDRGGNEVCIRLASGRAPLDLHRLWDGLITSTNNVGRLRNIATELLSKFSRVGLRELDQTAPRTVGQGKL